MNIDGNETWNGKTKYRRVEWMTKDLSVEEKSFERRDKRRGKKGRWMNIDEKWNVK